MVEPLDFDPDAEMEDGGVCARDSYVTAPVVHHIFNRESPPGSLLKRRFVIWQRSIRVHGETTTRRETGDKDAVVHP